MPRFWTSWISGYYVSDGCTEPPIQTWVTGEKDHPTDVTKSLLTICAVIDAENQETIEEKLKHHFPDMTMRFCDQKSDDFLPGSRFPDFENKTRFKD